METTNKASIVGSLRECLADRQGVVAAYLFGSAAVGRLAASSDIDVAILFQKGHQPDPLQRLAFREELSDLLGRDVDLVILDSAPVVLRMQVLKKGELLVNRDPKRLSRFSVDTLNEYFDLKQARRPIEEKLGEASIYD